MLKVHMTIYMDFASRHGQTTPWGQIIFIKIIIIKKKSVHFPFPSKFSPFNAILPFSPFKCIGVLS